MIKVITNMNRVADIGKYLVFNKQNWVAVNYYAHNKMPISRKFTNMQDAIKWFGFPRKEG